MTLSRPNKVHKSSSAFGPAVTSALSGAPATEKNVPLQPGGEDDEGTGITGFPLPSGSSLGPPRLGSLAPERQDRVWLPGGLVVDWSADVIQSDKHDVDTAVQRLRRLTRR